MSYFFVKTIINNLCRAVKILDNEEITISQFVERGKIFHVKTLLPFTVYFEYTYVYVALLAHELNASEIDDLDFSIKDSDNMIIDDIEMIKQWKLDSNFKVIIDLKVSRMNVDLVAEVYISFTNGIFISVTIC